MIHCTEEIRVVPLPGSTDILTDVLRAGAQKLLAQAIEAEVAEWIEQHRHCVDAEGHRLVVRNGHLPSRTITTGIGPLAVQQPRVRDRRPADQAEKFSSEILPPYLRKTKAVEELIPGCTSKASAAATSAKRWPRCWAPKPPGSRPRRSPA